MKELPAPQDAATRAAWAKYDNLGMTGDWLPLWVHLDDAAAVAELLFPRWLAPAQRRFLAETFGSETLALKLAVWLAAAHDVGKATSAFAQKVEPMRSRMESAGFVFPPTTAAEDRAFPHGLAGQRAVESRFGEQTGESGPRWRSALAIAEIIGGHHGAFPGNPYVPSFFSVGEPGIWKQVRSDLLDRADQLSGMTPEDWDVALGADITAPVQALLNGFLIVCDWIASDTRYFPLGRGGRESSGKLAETAIALLDFGDHWKPVGAVDTSDYFLSRFGIAEPRPVQADAVRAVQELEEPSLLLVEAPTGEGKTELAMAAAEEMARRFGMNGVMVALPTRATSDAMFGRVLDWLNATLARGTSGSAALVHGKAEFDELYQGLFQGFRARRVFDGEEETLEERQNGSVVANQWFTGRKRNTFADFVVGTVDQLLFMALKMKHLSLRHLGLSGKVVVIDEVHAADTFMQTYLHRALEWLGAYGVPVVALSATLPPEQRRALLQAYRVGAKGRQSRRELRADRVAEQLAESTQYPLVTAIGRSVARQVASEVSGRRIVYSVDEVGEDERIEAVLEAARDGGCIAVVLDTVDRAQKTYQALRERYDGEVQLLHSRFTTESRSQREKELVRRLGPDTTDRPERMIVVATQVIEASLDVDFDMMFSDFAPVDLLLQRMGRVHRHQRPDGERATGMGAARIVLTGGSEILTGSGVPEFESGVRAVYGESMLLRSALALRELLGSRDGAQIAIPDDVAGLVRFAYQEQIEVPDQWDEVFAAAEHDRHEKQLDQENRSSVFAIGSPAREAIAKWSEAATRDASESRSAAQVRDSEMSVEVVLVQELGGHQYSLPHLPGDLGGQQVDFMTGIRDDLARAVATCSVSLPSWMTRGSGMDSVLDDLEANWIPGWQNSYWLKGVLPLVLNEQMEAKVGEHRVRYDSELGLLVEAGRPNES